MINEMLFSGAVKARMHGQTSPRTEPPTLGDGGGRCNAKDTHQETSRTKDHRFVEECVSRSQNSVLGVGLPIRVCHLSTGVLHQKRTLAMATTSSLPSLVTFSASSSQTGASLLQCPHHCDSNVAVSKGRRASNTFVDNKNISTVYDRN